MDDEGAAPGRERPVPSFARAFALYNLGRLLLFAAATVLLFGVLGRNGLELLLLSLVLSALLSVFVLKRQRDDLGRAIQARAAARAARTASVRARLDETDAQ